MLKRKTLDMKNSMPREREKERMEIRFWRPIFMGTERRWNGIACGNNFELRPSTNKIN